MTLFLKCLICWIETAKVENSPNRNNKISTYIMLLAFYVVKISHSFHQLSFFQGHYQYSLPTFRKGMVCLN